MLYDANGKIILQTAEYNIEELTTHAALTTGVHGVGAGIVGIQNADKTIQDADGDTKVQTEEAADEDIIRMDTAGVETFKLSAIGELTLAKQSSALMSTTITQFLQSEYYCFIIFDTVTEDVQLELDVTIKTGTASATSANHLIDATLSPFVAGDVGRKVWNTTDNTYAAITAVNSASDVTLNIDIMANGEGYKCYFSKFTANEAGTYIVIGTVQLNSSSAAGVFTSTIVKNGGSAKETKMYTPVNNFWSLEAVHKIPLAVGDYIQLATNQNIAAAEDLWAAGTKLVIIKVT